MCNTHLIKPVVWAKLLNSTKNRTPDMCLVFSVCVSIFSTDGTFVQGSLEEPCNVGSSVYKNIFCAVSHTHYI